MSLLAPSTYYDNEIMELIYMGKALFDRDPATNKLVKITVPTPGNKGIPVRQFMIRSAQHVQYTYHPQNERTFPAHFPSRGLDFVLAPKPYKVKAARAIKSFASDHLPVLIDFSLFSYAKKLETRVSSLS